MTFRKRVKGIIVFFFAFYVAIVGRAFYYQVIGDSGIEKYCKTQYDKNITIPPARGAILDRNGGPLAITISTLSIGASPKRITSKRAIARISSRLLHVKGSVILAKLRSKRSFVYIKRQVPREVAKKFIKEVGTLEEFRKEYGTYGRITEFSLIPEPKRYYPGKELASNIIGFCNIDSIGLEGVEMTFDRYLKGKQLRLQVEKDAKGRLIIPSKIPEREVFGNTLQLTIDKNIQFICEKEIAEGVRKHRAKGGIAVVMSPVTGEIYAMAEYPSFDSNSPGKYSPWRRKDRIISDIYEPGSTFKVFLVAGALDSGRVHVKDRVNCEGGYYRVQGRTIHDTHPRQWLKVPEVIKYSSNIGAVKIAERLSAKKFYSYIQKFGFGKKSGIELAGEVRGIVPDRSSFTRPIRYATTAFGQGIAVTPIQMISAFSSVVNGGIALKPYIIKEVRDRWGKIVYRGDSDYVGRVISRGTSAMMRKILESVVTKEGTGSLAKVRGYSIGGKTGTSQKVDMRKGGYSDKRIASFIGFFPVKNPLVTILILVDEPEDEVYGGLVAAPIFRKIASKVALYAGIPPDERGREMFTVAKRKVMKEGGGEKKTMYPVQKVSLTDSEDGMYTMPNLRGLTIAQVIDMIEYLPVDYSFAGSGVVVKQVPSAGSRIQVGGQCRVVFGEK